MGIYQFDNTANSAGVWSKYLLEIMRADLTACMNNLTNRVPACLLGKRGE